ncbi:MAG TPA: glycosyltransferase [Puia sp.]|jgi:hypothetical protein
MRKLAIIHFNPVEMYPPVMNWINYVAERADKDWEVRVYTTHSLRMEKEFTARGIKIIRVGAIPQSSAVRRYTTYFKFYTGVTRRLVAWQPDTLLYFETISSFPALWYKRWIRPSSRVMIHYHEYMSPGEYLSGMVLNRWFHGWEQKMYPRASWISQTNEERLAKFEQDNAGINFSEMHVMPNFPPASWTMTSPKVVERPLRIVYAGSLSQEAMYAREFAEWVLAQKGKVIWDIYAVNISSGTKAYLEGLDKALVRFKGACDYFDLPAVLSGYDVGVVLYKGIIPNHVIAVSNKVFEYLARGLDVWYSQEMTGTYPYDTDGVYPKVLRIDCRRLDSFDMGKALDRGGLCFRAPAYYAEPVYERLYEKIASTK